MKKMNNFLRMLGLMFMLVLILKPDRIYAAGGNTYALYIGGVGSISDNSINAIKKVINNNKLKSYSGNKYSNICRFNADGTKSVINSSIDKAYKRCTSKDLAIFFYNGHGASKNGKGLGLALSSSAYYPYYNLAKKLHNVKCKKMMVIIDACYAGAFYDKGISRLPAASQKKFILFLSSAHNETSQFSGNYSRYSMAIAEGLGKNGIVNADFLKKDGNVTAKELAAYLDIRMKNQLLTNWPEVNPKHYSSNSNFAIYSYNPLSISKASAKLYTVKYKTVQLKVSAFKKNVVAKWRSSNPSVATVTSTGKVTAKKAGTTTVYATAYGNTVKCLVTVVKPSIKLNKTSAALNLISKKTVQLKVTVMGKSKTVTWKSNNSSVANVSKTGKVTAKHAGTAIITVSANGLSAKCTVKASGGAKYNIYGTWEIDSELTMKKNGVSMVSLFGSGYKYGNGMEYSNDGSFSYYVGIGYGGKGTFSYNNRRITYSIKQYEDGWISKGTMAVSKISNKVYIIQNCKDFLGETTYQLYWGKK